MGSGQKYSKQALDLIAKHAANMIIAELNGDTNTAEAEQRRAQMVARSTGKTKE